ncbi:MAG: hypothetical protein AB1521_15250 [Bacteroidota bacterium]
MKSVFKIIPVIFVIILYACEREKITEPIDDSIPPSIPTGLNVYGASDGEIGIEWVRNYESNLKGYNIYRSQSADANFLFIDFTTSDYYIDDSLDYNTTYYYKITAINRIGKESGFSLIVSATPLNVYRPLTPYNVIAIARNRENSHSMTISWEKSLETDIKEYEIYRGDIENFTADSSTLHDIYTSNSNSINNYTDTLDLDILKPYYYKVRAVDKGNLKSHFSNEVNDKVLDVPILTYPLDNGIIKDLFQFKFITASLPAQYKLVIQSNEVYGTVYEMDFGLDKIKEEVSVNPSNLFLELNKKYYWRVLTYTASSEQPNSYSNLYSFTVTQ